MTPHFLSHRSSLLLLSCIYSSSEKGVLFSPSKIILTDKLSPRIGE